MLQRRQSLGTLRTPIGSLVKVRDLDELGALQATMNQLFSTLKKRSMICKRETELKQRRRNAVIRPCP